MPIHLVQIVLGVAFVSVWAFVGQIVIEEKS